MLGEPFEPGTVQELREDLGCHRPNWPSGRGGCLVRKYVARHRVVLGVMQVESRVHRGGHSVLMRREQQKARILPFLANPETADGCQQHNENDLDMLPSSVARILRIRRHQNISYHEAVVVESVRCMPPFQGHFPAVEDAPTLTKRTD